MRILKKESNSVFKPYYNFDVKDLTLWNAVIDWLDLIPVQALGDMMAKHLFPRWLQVTFLVQIWYGYMVPKKL